MSERQNKATIFEEPPVQMVDLSPYRHPEDDNLTPSELREKALHRAFGKSTRLCGFDGLDAVQQVVMTPDDRRKLHIELEQKAAALLADFREAHLS